MSDEKVNSSALELEEKVAVGAVFLLAGWFLWQFLGSNEGAVPFRNEPELLEEDASRVRLFPDDSASQLEQDINAGMRTEPVMVAEQSAVTVQPITEPVIPAQKRWVNRSEVAAPSVGVSTNLDAVPHTVKPVLEIAKEPVTSVKVETPPTVTPTWPDVVPHTAKPVKPIVEPVKPIVETVKPAIVTKSISTSAAPTIQPVTSDLSQGLLRLSGTGKPGGHLQLLLNGRKASNILVDAEGNWHYESNLKPGEYSVQVLSMELDEQMGVQSALAQVTIPKPQVEVFQPVEPVVNPVVMPDEVIGVIDQQASGDSAQKLNDRFYKVTYGDTLNKLARRFRVSLRSLIRANKISDKNQIEVGQMLIIPGRYPGRTK